MKTILSKLSITLFLLLLASTSQAQLIVGWSTSVSASNGSSVQTILVSEPSQGACEASRSNAIATLASLGFTVVISAPSCTPITRLIDIPREIYWEERIKFPWPWPPVCLSCPYLSKDLLEVVYPELFEKAVELMDKFQIESYQKDLMQLQEKYKLEYFEEAMFELGLEGLEKGLNH